MTIEELNKFTEVMIKQGKGDYQVIDGYMGKDIAIKDISINNDDKYVIF